MLNFYQSKTWKYIQESVYKNSTFEIDFLKKKYRWVIKKKKVWPFVLKWYQILGIDFSDDIDLIKKELINIKKKYSWSFLNIFFQFWIINEIVRFNNFEPMLDDFKKEFLKNKKLLSKKLNSDYGLKISFRENMPHAGILYDVSKSDDKLLSEMNQSCRKRIKKAIDLWLVFQELDLDQVDVFYSKWSKVAGNKWFNVIARDQYDRLIKYINNNDCWKVLVASLDGEILAWSICVYDSKQCFVCLYGFADRDFAKVWLNHFLKFKTFVWARENGFDYVDTMGGWPLWFEKHSLALVTEFKQSLWGQKIEYRGSYDLVLNKFLYKVFKFYYGLKR